MRPAKKVLIMAISLTGFLIFLGCSGAKTKTGTAAAISQGTAENVEQTGAMTLENKTEVPAPGTAYVRDIIFDTLKGKERISVLLSEIPPFTVTRDSENALLLKMEKIFIPEELCKIHGEGRLDNVYSVFPFQKTEGEEKLAFIKINLKKMVPYRVGKDDSGIITIDFDVSSLSSTGTTASPSKAVTNREIPEQHEIAAGKEKAGAERGEIKKYTGEVISIDLQGASIKSAFRLISEVSGMNIVAAPDVLNKTVTMRINKIPWDQALDAILEVNGLGKKESGTVITVLPLEELKKAEEEQQKRDAAEGKLRQISIEARIVEATTEFSRNLGVLWGGGFRGTWGSRDYGLLMGNSSSGKVTTFPSNIGFTNSNAAVNFPSATAVASPAIGMILGSGSMILDAQLSALEETGDGKIISSPRVTALEGNTAWIQQGKEVPFRTLDKDGNPTTDFEDVVLRLEVTPNITPDGRISMKIKANNDELDWANAVAGNPATSTSAVESTIVVKDGDTIVIGGVYKTIESQSEEGVPYLSKIPVLGWLFKYQSKSNETRELLVFVTPRIIDDESEKGKYGYGKTK